MQDTDLYGERDSAAAAEMSAKSIDGQDFDSSISSKEFEQYLSDTFKVRFI